MEWTDSAVIDFVNWYIKAHQLSERFNLENQNLIDSFKQGDKPELWWTNKEPNNELRVVIDGSVNPHDIINAIELLTSVIEVKQDE